MSLSASPNILESISATIGRTVKWSKHTCRRQTAPLSSSTSSPSATLWCMIWLAGIACGNLIHLYRCSRKRAGVDGRQMTGAIELPALSIGMSPQLHPLRTLKGNFLWLIEERWMSRWGPRSSSLSSFSITTIHQLHSLYSCIKEQGEVEGKSLLNVTLQVDVQTRHGWIFNQREIKGGGLKHFIFTVEVLFTVQENSLIYLTAAIAPLTAGRF